MNPAPHHESQSLAALLVARAIARGDAIAVDDGKSQLSYATLLARARALASMLAPQEGPVGILLPMQADYIVAIVAALLAGKTYVPMDDGFPESRNQRIVSHSGMSAVIVDDSTAATMQALDPAIERIPVATASGLADTPAGASAADDAPFDRIITIFYTSGSTGEPKGVCHSQSGLLYDVQYFAESHGLSEDDVHSLLFSPSVSISNRDIFATLLVGAKLSIVDLKRLGIAGALQAMHAYGITVLHCVPSAFRALFNSDDADAKAVADRIRIVRLNGDRVLQRDVEVYRRAFPRGSRLSLDLASTETRPYAAWMVDHDTPLPRPLVPVGYLRPDLHVVLLTDDGAPAAVGEVGEITVASHGLSAGYWRDEALTREKFTPSVRHPGMTEYRTGDFGRLLPDGLLEFVGRRDRQIKVRGNTLHLGEIEAAIGACPGVGDVAVVGRDDGVEIRLVAYCTGSGGDAQATTIRAWCRQHLAPAKCPADVIVSASLPMLGPGKVDLVEVGRLDAERAARQASARPATRLATNALVDAVALAWTARLGRAAYADDKTFENAGGDSLQAMVLILELERRLGRSLPNGLIDLSTRPSDLAARIEALDQAAPDAGRHAGKPTIVLFPGIYGADFASVAFARRLADEFPVLLMDYRSASGELIGPADREYVFSDFDARMAAEGVPQRLWLMGYSFGSRVAAEAARRLLNRGVDVEFVGVIDGPTDPAIAARNERNAIRQVAKPPLAKRIAADGCVLGFASGRVAASVAHRLVTRGDFKRLRDFIAWLSRLGLEAAAAQATRVAIGRTRAKAFKNLPEAPLQMPVSLFVSTAPYSESRQNPDLGWADWCAKLEVFELDGDHHEIIDEARSGNILPILRDAEARLRPIQAA
jgi:amino acid adenylation domain-containing protein